MEKVKRLRAMFKQHGYRCTKRTPKLYSVPTTWRFSRGEKSIEIYFVHWAERVEVRRVLV